MSGIIDYIIEDVEGEIRLDRYLREKNKQLTQSMIEKLLRKKLIKYNGIKTKSSVRIKNGDILRIHSNIILTKQNETEIIYPKPVISLAGKLHNEYMIFENEDLIAINKPASLSVQGGTNIKISVDDALKYLNTIEGNNYKIVHRLDKDTSGVLLIAKNRIAAQKLANAFKEKIINKTYYALLDGELSFKEKTVKIFLEKNVKDQKQNIVTKDFPNADEAITKIKVLECKNLLTLVEFKPITGRMHQLRVLAEYLNAPIIGDKKYGNNKVRTSNLMLHSFMATIPKEIFGKDIIIKSQIPESFLEMLTKNLFKFPLNLGS